MKKSELNRNIYLSEGNMKSKGTDNVMFLTWSLPCKITCPYSTEMCRKRCFAQKNQYFKSVLASRMRNYDESQKDTFERDMINHLEYQLQRPKSQTKRVFVRIHTSGDFYNLEYFKKWVQISEHFRENKRILFQAYTKSMPILESFELDSNLLIKDINIHLVWSIWSDTPKEFNEKANIMKLQTFTALPKNEIEEYKNKKAFICNGDCGNCKQCYTGKSLEIIIPYH